MNGRVRALSPRSKRKKIDEQGRMLEEKPRDGREGVGIQAPQLTLLVPRQRLNQVTAEAKDGTIDRFEMSARTAIQPTQMSTGTALRMTSRRGLTATLIAICCLSRVFNCTRRIVLQLQAADPIYFCRTRPQSTSRHSPFRLRLRSSWIRRRLRKTCEEGWNRVP